VSTNEKGFTMGKKYILRYCGNYIFFSAAFFLFELMLRLSIPRQFDFIGFVFSVVFNLIFVLFFCSIMNFVTGKAHEIVNNIVLSIATGLYVSQIIYFNVFGTFYNTESLFNAGQIVEFWVIILGSIWEKLIFILPCVAVIAVYNILVKKSALPSFRKEPDLKQSERTDNKRFIQFRKIALGITTTLSLTMLTVFVPFAVDSFSPYSSFFGQQSYEDSIQRTGLLSTLQVDVLKVFVSGDSASALTALDEMRTTEQTTLVTPSPTPTTPVATPQPPAGAGAGSEDDPDDEPEEDEPPPEPVVYGYNVMDIDFEELIANESRASVRALHEYFSNEQPSQQNEFTGMFEGYNLVMFVAEAFSPLAVHPEVTPTLYKMVHEGFHFTNFYTALWGVNTSDGEYVAMTGLLPKERVWSFYQSRNNYLPFVMGNQLASLGYKTASYHNHTHTYYRRHLSHPNMGYEFFKAVGNGLELPRVVWPNSDYEMIQVTIDDYINYQPFHAYYMTVSGHSLYTFDGNMMSRRNREAVEHLPYSESLRAYLACHIELDKALEYLMDRLNEAGIAENTFIVLSTDHLPHGLPGTLGVDGYREFFDRPIDTDLEIFQNNLIIYAQGMEPVTVDKLSSSLDIIPTVSNLMGLEFDSRLLMGRDILSNSEPLVPMHSGTFITENGHSIRGRDFVPNPGATVDDNYADYIRAIIRAKFSASVSILDLDYYRILFG